jgi:hypothetical protein
MLFVLIMGVLDALICKADEWELFGRFGFLALRHRTSIYANDFVMFISPTVAYLKLCWMIFQLFEEASGLGCNLSKCQMALIRCTLEQIQVAEFAFPYQMVDFPIKHHGLPLAIKKLPRSVLQSQAGKINAS